MKLRKLWWAIGLAPLCAPAAFAIAQNTGTQNSAQSATTTPGSASAAQRARQLDVLKTPTKDDLIRGTYGPYRANNDLLSYVLKLRVDPDARSVTLRDDAAIAHHDDGLRPAQRRFGRLLESVIERGLQRGVGWFDDLRASEDDMHKYATGEKPGMPLSDSMVPMY